MRSKLILVCSLAGCLMMGVVQAEDVPEFLVEMDATGDVTQPPAEFGFGMDPAALNGVDSFDVPGPPAPPPSQVGAVAFVNAGAGTDFYRDVVPSASVVTWDLRVSNLPAGGSTTLTWDISNIPSFLALGEKLTIKQTGGTAPATDMTAQSQLTVTNTAGFATNYQLEIIYNATVPAVRATQNGTSTTEAGGAATFTVKLGSEPTATVTIDMTSSDTGEATVAPAQLTFTAANWDTPQTVTVTGVNDDVEDGDQDVDVSFTVTSTDADYSALTPPTSLAFVNADDGDTAGITVTLPSPMHTTETGTPLSTFTVTLDSEPTANVIIDVSSSDTSEITVAPTQLTFTAANWNTPQTVTATGVNDDIDDDDQVVNVSLTVTSTDAKYDGMALDDRILLNDNDDIAGITVTPTSGLTTDETGATAQFTVKLDSEPTADVTIPVASTDTGEGTVSTAQLTFTAANWNAPQTVTVTGVNDDIDDGNVGYTIDLGPVASADAKYDAVAVSDVAVTNNDDADTAGFTVTPTSIITTESGGAATVTIVLQSEPAGNVVFDVTSSETTEAAPSVATVTFTPTNWGTPQTVTIVGVDDDVADGPQAFTVAISPNAAQTDDDLYDALPAQIVSGTNTDDDVPTIVISKTVGHETTEETGDEPEASFTVNLKTAPQGTVTVTVESSKPTEGTVSPTTLTFTDQNYATPQTVQISGEDDQVYDNDIPYSVILTFSSTVPGEFYDGKQRSVSVTNIDNEIPPTNDLTFLPASNLDIGSIYVGEQKYAELTIGNDGTEAVQLSVQIAGDDAFSVRNTDGTYTRDLVTLPAIPGKVGDASGQLKVRVNYTADTTSSTAAGSLTFLDSSSQVVKVLALSGTTLAPLNGGELRMSPGIVEAKIVQGETTATIQFDVELNAAATGATYIDLFFTISLPSVINTSSLTLTTNTSRTNGLSFASEFNGTELTLTYTDFSGVGIAPGDGPIVTLICTVDTTGDEQVYPVTLYDISSTAVTGTYGIAGIGGQLQVRKPTANLDVNKNGIADFRDVVLVYRSIRLNKTAAAGNLVLTGYDPDGLGAEAIEQNILDLKDNGLDVNGNGTPDFRDVVLIYRKIRLGKTAAAGNLVLTGYDPAAIGGEAIEANIDDILP